MKEQKWKEDSMERDKHLQTSVDNIHSQTKEIMKKRLKCKMHKRADEIMKKIDLSDTKAAEVHAMSSGQIDKLKRMWVEEDIRNRYYKFRKQREKEDRKANENYCKVEREGHVTVFSAIRLENGDEVASAALCIEKNRDQLIGAFCNFRNDFDTLLKNANLKNSAHYWPNLCCKDLSKDEREKDPCKRGYSTRKNCAFRRFAGWEKKQSNPLR